MPGPRPSRKRSFSVHCRAGHVCGKIYLPIAAHFSFSQTFSVSFKRGLSIS